MKSQEEIKDFLFRMLYAAVYRHDCHMEEEGDAIILLDTAKFIFGNDYKAELIEAVNKKRFRL